MVMIIEARYLVFFNIHNDNIPSRVTTPKGKLIQGTQEKTLDHQTLLADTSNKLEWFLYIQYIIQNHLHKHANTTIHNILYTTTYNILENI